MLTSNKMFGSCLMTYFGSIREYIDKLGKLNNVMEMETRKPVGFMQS